MPTRTPNPICCAGAFHSPTHLLADIKYNNSYHSSMAKIWKDKFSYPKWEYRKLQNEDWKLEQFLIKNCSGVKIHILIIV